MKRSVFIVLSAVLIMILVAATLTNIDDFFFPGSQVGQSGNIETPERCDNCHGGYDLAVEPALTGVAV